MIKLGIIGTANPEFRDVFHPALAQLKQKTRVVAVYDPVRKRAELAAALCEAEVISSFQRLIRRSDIEALLVLSPGWYGAYPVALGLEEQKVVFCTCSVWNQCQAEGVLQDLAEKNDALLVIESQFRYWPASLRTRELLASQLGPVVRLSCASTPGSPSAIPELGRYELADLLDWSRFLLDRSRILPDPQRCPSGYEVQFGRVRKGVVRDAVPVELTSHAPDEERPVLRLECQAGSVEIWGPQRLRWHLHADSETCQREEILNEQSCVFRQFDHFCRRVAGGLIPVHDLTDALWSRRAAMTLEAL